MLCFIGFVQYMLLCFALACASMYRWIMCVYVFFADYSVRQRNVCSTRYQRQISPLDDEVYHIVILYLHLLHC